MNQQETNADRLNHLESALAYLQNDYDQLNGAVLENTKRLAQIKQAVAQIKARLDSFDNGSESPRDLKYEKPPHY